MKRDVEPFLKRLMVVLLTLRAECSLVTSKPAHLSPYLPPGCLARSGLKMWNAEGFLWFPFVHKSSLMCILPSFGYPDRVYRVGNRREGLE